MARAVFTMVAMAALVVVTILGAAAPACAQPPKVTLGYPTYMGSGCNYENTNYVISNDYKTITFIYGGMIATTDSGLAGKRKFCQVSLPVNYPNGWSLSLGQVTGRGFADLAKGTKGVYQTSYYWAGQVGTARCARTIYGKFTGDYEFTDKFLTLVYSQCNSAPALNIKTEVRVDGKKGVMTLDSSDKSFKLIFALIWKMC